MTMLTRDDRLRLTPEVPDRVFYATGVLLDADDFEAEQLYHRGRLARALSLLHGDGTVAGLRVELVTPEAGGEQVIVHPGLAIDRVGRLIEVPRRACIRLDRWYQSLAERQPAELDAAFHESVGGVVADVFLRFVACPRGKTPAFAEGPFDATDAVQPSRLRDGYEVRLFLRKEETLPLPAPWWGEITGDTPEARLQSLHALIFQEWGRPEREWREDAPELEPRREHIPNQDTTSVFLARLVLPAARGAPNTAPVRTEGAAVTIDNDSRLFVYPVGALARWVGV